MGSDGTVDVNIGSEDRPQALLGLRMTTACAGAAVGSRVLVETLNNVSYVTGVLANADNVPYVKSDIVKEQRWDDIDLRGYRRGWMAMLTVSRNGKTTEAQFPANAHQYLGSVKPEFSPPSDVWALAGTNGNAWLLMCMSSAGNLTALPLYGSGTTYWSTFNVSICWPISGQ